MSTNQMSQSQNGAATGSQEQLQSREAELDHFFEISFDLLCIADMDSRFQRVNPAFERTLGWSTDEVLSRSLLDLVYPDDLPGTLAAIGKLTHHSKMVTFENRCRCKDGSYKWLAWNVRPLSNELLCGVGRDISRDKAVKPQGEEAARHRRRQVETSTEVAQEIATAPALDELFRRVVGLVQARFGYYHAHVYTLEEDNLIMQEGTGQAGRQMKAEGHKIALMAKQSLVARAAREGQPVLAPDVRQEPDWLPNPLLPDTKSEIAVPIKLRNEVLGVLDVQHDAVGGLSEEDQLLLSGLCGQIAVAIDHRRAEAERERLLAEVQESERLIRTIIDSTPDWIFVKDRHHRYHMVNQGYARSLHRAPEDFVGRNDLELGFPEEIVKGDPEKGISGFWASDRAVMESGEVTITPSVPAMVDGKARTVSAIKVPLRDDKGEVWGILGYVRDITENKRVEEQLRASEAKLSEALGIARMGYWEFDLENQMFNFNDQFYSILGTTAEQEGGYQMSPAQYAQKFVHPEDAGLIRELQQALEAADLNDDNQLEYRLLQADGQERYVVARFKLVHDKQDQKIKGYGTIQDITESRRVEKALAERARMATYEAEVALALTQNASQKDLLQACTEIMVEYLDAAFARIWLFNPADNVLELKASAGMYTHLDGAHSRVPVGQFKIGLIAQERRPHLTNDVVNDPRVGDKEWARREGMVAFAGYPLLIEDRLLGVMAMFARQPLQEFVLQAMALTANTLVLAIENKQQEEERERLLTEVQRLAAIVENHPDFIGTGTLDGQALYVNPAGLRMIGLPADHDITQMNALDFYPAADAEKLIKEGIPTALKEGSWSAEVNLRTVDGVLIPVDETVAINYDAKGNPVNFSLTMRDITERKQAEETLAKRATELETVAQVSTQIATVLDPAQLLQAVVDLTKESFALYHAHIYLLDEQGNILNLAAGAGEVGRKMVASSWSIPLDHEASLVALAARTRQGVIANDVRQNPDFLPNPLLPHTQSEMAVPIISGDTILGVLDVQSDKLDQFTDEDVRIQTTLAAQVAVALQNARYIERSERALAELNALTRRLTREGWENYLDTITPAELGYIYDLRRLQPIQDDKPAELTGAALTQPLTVRGETIGQLALAEPGLLTDAAAEIIAAVAERLSIHVENLRLSEQTQIALVEQERLTRDLETVAKVSAAASTILDTDELLQAVVNLTKESFNLYHAHIYLLNEEEDALNLAAGAGEVGRKMVAEGWSIPLSQESSLVAQSARMREGVVVNNVREIPDFLLHPLLLETKAEMAVPMIVGNKLWGVLDVQSEKEGRFTEEDVRIQTTLAAQIAVALQNANLYARQASTITRLRELERLKSSFLANMSHELRTPLNSIIGFADIILAGLHGPLVESLENDMKVIQKNGQHLLSLINDVLDMAKIEAGRMNLQPENFDLREVLEETLDITGPLAREKSLELQLKIESTDQLNLEADRFRLRQVMINLISNAIKFTESGSVTVKAEKRDGWVKIGVHDTGIGIPPEQVEVIFEAFRQGDTSTTRKAEGTGLGLLISRHLVELHGGRLWVESAGVPGEGSSFYVELPVESAYQPPVVIEE